jgi:hypothetical protein
MIRMNEPPDAVRDPHVVREAVITWQTGLLNALGAAETWEEASDADYSTNKPDWDGYGAVMLLAAYDERPDLAPGTRQPIGCAARPSRRSLLASSAKQPLTRLPGKPHSGTRLSSAEPNGVCRSAPGQPSSGRPCRTATRSPWAASITCSPSCKHSTNER